MLSPFKMCHATVDVSLAVRGVQKIVCPLSMEQSFPCCGYKHCHGIRLKIGPTQFHVAVLIPAARFTLIIKTLTTMTWECSKMISRTAHVFNAVWEGLNVICSRFMEGAFRSLWAWHWCGAITVWEVRALRMLRALSWRSSLTSMSTFSHYKHQRYVMKIDPDCGHI